MPFHTTLADLTDYVVKLLISERKIYIYLADNITTLDFETTGFSAERDEIIQVGAIKYRSGIEVARFDRFVQPRQVIPYRITQLTGITEEMVQDAPPLAHTLIELYDFLKGETIVAHNASFDMRFLRENFYRHGISNDQYPVIDTVKVARHSNLTVPNFKLETLKDFLNIHTTSHSAINDCFVTGSLYYHCKKLQEL